MVLDPLSAISLASNIVSFIDFGSDIISESCRLYHGAQSSDNFEFEYVAVSLRHFSNLLRPTLNNQANQLSEEEKQLLSILRACKDVANELLQAVQRLKSKDTHNKKWNSLRQALSSIWQKEKLFGLQSRLKSLRDQVTFHLVACVSFGQNDILKKMDDLKQDTETTKLNRDQELDRISTEIKSTRISQASMPTKADLDQIALVIKNSLAAAADLSKEIEIIQSLHSESLLTRYSRIAETYQNTFNWVFDKDQLPQDDPRWKVGLKTWLECKEGIFWVSGKPGSGKSTLLKYLNDDPRTMECLQCWAGTSKIATASFYFWNPGTSMQKSTQGLLQSLLCEILRQWPELIPRVCSSRWNGQKLTRLGSWKFAELRRAFQFLQGEASKNRKFCFFIDGLDEYEGDHYELLETMFQIAKSPYIKLCLSSRPWNCFVDALGGEYDNKLYMQDLTQHDIEIYARSKLILPTKWATERKYQVQHQDLALEIVNRAQGVFLWVYLVVKSLQNGLANGDSLSMLQTRLYSLPTDLNTYFAHILRSADSIYEAELGAILKVALLASRPLSLLTYSFLNEDDPDFAIKLFPSPLTIEEKDEREEKTRRRINGISKGLLEVSKANSIVCDGAQVEFLHRTVHEFLNTKKVRLVLDDMTPKEYNAWLKMGRALLARFKTIHVNPGSQAALSDLLEILGCTSKAEENYGVSDTAMLEELKRASSGNPSAPDSEFPTQMEIDFLQYAIRKGLVDYVERTLNRVPQLVSSMEGALLASALGISPTVSHIAPMETKVAPMLLMLFKHNMSPNALLSGGFSVWQYFLCCYQPGNYDNQVPRRNLARQNIMLGILLSRGVNVQDGYDITKYIVTDIPKYENSADEVLKTFNLVFSHGLDPNKIHPDGYTAWTRFLAKACPNPGSREAKSLLYKIAKLFLRYGADPSAKTGLILRFLHSPVDEDDSEPLKEVLMNSITYFKSREMSTRKRQWSTTREPRKRLHYGD